MPLIPDQLYEDIKQSRVVLLCGAGTTTEWGPYGTPSFYDIVRARAGLTDQQPPTAFPDVMQYFCDNVDGGDKRRLIQEAIERIEMFAQPNEMNRWATGFYKLVAMVPFFDRIVTTNWDPFCERTLNILVPMIEGRDLSFWNDTKRQVLKIHGCVTRPYTMIATRMDYSRCVKENPLIWNKLKDLMVTKHFLVIGYSMRDDDFLSVFEEITTALGSLKGLTYAFDPNATEEIVAQWKAKRVQVVKGTAAGLMYELIERLRKDGELPSEELIELYANEGDRITKLHMQMEQKESEGAAASAMYQDGVLHALEEVLSGTSLGTRRIVFDEQLREANETLQKYAMAGNHVEVAYWTGRREVFQRFNARVLDSIPAYLHPRKMIPINKYEK